MLAVCAGSHSIFKMRYFLVIAGKPAASIKCFPPNSQKLFTLQKNLAGITDLIGATRVTCHSSLWMSTSTIFQNLMMQSNMDDYWMLRSNISKIIFPRLHPFVQTSQGCVTVDKVVVYIESSGSFYSVFSVNKFQNDKDLCVRYIKQNDWIVCTQTKCIQWVHYVCTFHFRSV